ncbi:DNA mismatch repair protein Msh2 [Ixodes scapularis]
MHYKAARDLGLEAGKTIKLESNKELGFHFRITRKEERALRSRKGYVVIDTKQNGVRFRSPDLLSSNASYLDTRKAYEEAQQSIAKMIVDIAGGYAEPMHQLSDVISHLDVLVGLAVAAASASKPYVRPKILEKGSGILKMTGLRHASALSVSRTVCFCTRTNTEGTTYDTEAMEQHGYTAVQKIR